MMRYMNIKIGIAILVAACVGLAVVLAVVKKQDNQRHETTRKRFSDFSNRLDEATTNLIDLRQTNLKLNGDLDASRTAALQLSNNLVEAKSALVTADTAFQNAQRQITNAQLQIATTSHRSRTSTPHRFFGGAEPGARPARQPLSDNINR